MLLLNAAILIATGAVYAYVGLVTWRRRVGGEAQLASDLFATFWLALAATTAAGALPRIMAYLGVADLALYATITHVNIFAICIALWGLLYYLLYLFTGKRGTLIPVSIFYVLFYAWLVYILAVRTPTGLEVDGWNVRLTYATEIQGPVITAFALLLILPPVLGAAGYARLFFKVDDPTQRYRIGLVSFTILAWFGTILLVFFLQVGSGVWWQIASRLIGLAAAYLIYAAYRPPAWVRTRWGIRRIDEPAGA
jgi:hypothetical protein